MLFSIPLITIYFFKVYFIYLCVIILCPFFRFFNTHVEIALSDSNDFCKIDNGL